MKIISLTKNEIEEAFKANKSIRQILNDCGVDSNGSGAYKVFNKHCKDLGVIIPKIKQNKKILKENLNFIEIFKKDSTFAPNPLKRKILKYKLIEYKCEKCSNLGEWCGKQLILQLDHKNGVNNDNRLENLRFLCPNCHTQTETFSSKKQYFCECGTKITKKSKLCIKCHAKKNGILKRKNISFDLYSKLKESVEKIGYRKTGANYGVTGTTIKLWIINFEKSEFNHGTD